jgi:hypothetical protein
MGSPVILNVYDLSEFNSWIYWFGAGGVYHSGVEVHDEEFAFGGHEYDMSGIFVTGPRDAPGPVLYRESVILGETYMSKEEVHAEVAKMGKEYKGNLYHLLQRNCNHFSEDLAYRLCQGRPPSWVNRLAGLAVCLHCLLPPTWVPPLATPRMSPVLPEGAEAMPGEERQSLLMRNGVIHQPSTELVN